MTAETESYTAEILAWRARAEAGLRAEDGWLALVGLFWLQEGENTVGSAPSSAVRLPESAAAEVGQLLLRDGRVTLRVRPGVTAMLDGESVAERELRPDTDGPPDRVRIGDVALWVIVRGQRVGVRVSDPDSPTRRDFGGRHWFPVDPAYRIPAHFEPYDPPKTLAITNILGDTSDVASPGAVVFELDGQEHRLDASSLSEHGLFLVFRDRTSGGETYGAARFLSAAPPQDGRLTLDFNRAVHPPCAFTEFATCPLPPRQNHLPVRIAAGERLGESE
ncbi:MAG TPA: DUF1684 domain-containing protein [Roseiflexaceae bacterium]|nr:DUF1684 domain-containing protein [Roseiflexaceae bacterium]